MKKNRIKELENIARELYPELENIKVWRTGQYLMDEHAAKNDGTELTNQRNEPITDPDKKYQRTEKREVDHLAKIKIAFRRKGMQGVGEYVTEANARFAKNANLTPKI
jgi:hypothetical protein